MPKLIARLKAAAARSAPYARALGRGLVGAARLAARAAHALAGPAASLANHLSLRDIGRAALLGALGWASAHAAFLVGFVPVLGSLPGAVALAVAVISAVKDLIAGPVPAAGYGSTPGGDTVPWPQMPAPGAIRPAPWPVPPA